MPAVGAISASTTMEERPGLTGASGGMAPESEDDAEKLVGLHLLRDGALRAHGPVKISVCIERNRYLAEVHGKQREICVRSLYIFDALGPVRQHVLWLVEWRWFEHIILFLIFFSSVNLAIYRYRVPDSPVNDFTAISDVCLTVLFTLECILKVIAYGLIVDRGTYLRSGWNWLDFIVVISGWLDELPTDSANLRFLLVFKVLRPLRSLTVMPQMRLLVNTVLLSMKRLSQFCLMVVFLFSVFSIVGLNFWAGVMYRQCRTSENPIWDVSQKCWSWPPADGSDRLCGGRYSCEAGQRCGTIYLDDPLETFHPKFDAFPTLPQPGRIPGTGAPWCDDTAGASNSEDFNFHLTHFDHMPGALLVVFQCMTLEGWVDLMYMLQDADSDVVASLYFVVLVVATAFFLLNAALAIVTETFDDMYISKEEALAQEEEMESSASPRIFGQDQTWASSRIEEDRKGIDQKKVSPEADHKEQNAVTVLKAGEVETEADVKPEVRPEVRPELRPELNRRNTEDEFMNDVEWNNPPWWDVPVVRMFRAIASNDWFMNIVMLFILFNVLTMCLDRYPPPSASDFLFTPSFLQVCNYIFAVAFTIEMIILLIAMGPKSYCLTLMTAFDGTIVIASWVEICMSGGGGAVRAFRGLRLMRIFKLAKKLVSLRIMLKAMWNTVASLGNLAILLFLMIFIFTLMGREFFACKFHMDDNGHLMDTDDTCHCGEPDNYDCVPRAHFDTFIWAFVTVFQILTGENWNAIMYDGMKKNTLLLFYFVLVMVFGQFIMLSLFLAVLMSKFEESRTAQQAAEEERKKVKHAFKASQVTEFFGSFASNVRQSLMRAFTASDMERDLEADNADFKDGTSVLPGDTPKDESGGATPKKPRRRWVWYLHYAFFVLSPDNQLRMACRNLVENKKFDQAVLVCICISSLAMALDQPMANPEAVLTQILYWMGVVFTVIFTVEMLLKMIAFGCFYGATYGKRAYWLQPWNVLDGIVVIVSILDITTQGSGALGALKTTRIIRALRPLRVVARFQNLRLVVQTLFKSVPALANVLVVGVLVFLIFALFFCRNLKGMFYQCMGSDLEGYTFDKNVTYVNSAAGEGLTPAFNSSGVFLHLTAAEMARLVMNQPTPLCLNVTSGIVTALGYVGDTGRWVVDPACPDGLVQTVRPTKDTPICVGRCRPNADKDDPRPPQCPPPPVEVSELPSLCPESSSSPSEAELRGRSYYDSLIRREIMFCGSPPAASAALSCSEAFCPGGRPDRIEQCREDCKAHEFWCTDSCKEGSEGTKDCALCREQCEAQCQCEEFCEGFVKDAGNCVEQQGRWLQALSQDFDNIFTSFVSLVEISTTEGWVDVMYQAVDAVDPYMQPERDNQEIWAIAFMFFIFVSFFFYINLCVGVIVDNYNAIKEDDGECLMTKEQMDWIATHRNLHKRTLFFGLTNLDRAPSMQVRAYRFIAHPAFENFIMFCIVGNTLSMALKQFPEPSKEYEDAREVINWIFGGIFFMEMVVKLFALHMNYFKENWNIFDFCCVMTMVIGLIISMASDVQMTTAMSAIRAFRIARLFRLVRFLKGLNRMFTALLLSLPKLINVGAILLLFFFLFSVLGVQLFAKTKFHGPIGEHANFRNPVRAFLTLLRSVTGEGWNELMHALSRDMKFYTWSLGEICINEDMLTVDKSTYPILQEKCLIDNPNACGKDMSYVYFLIFTGVMTMVMVNLMIAVILEAFTDSASSDLMEVINTCIRKWPKYDVNLRLKLPLRKTFQFIQEVAEDHHVEFVKPESSSSSGEKGISIFGPSKVDFDLLNDEHPQASQCWADVPMKIAKLCGVQVLEDGNVHFLFAVRMALAVTLSHNSLRLMADFEEAEGLDERLQTMRSWQVRRCLSQEAIKTSTPLQEQVGAAKIQAMFRSMRKWKRAKKDKDERQASNTDMVEEVKEEASSEACGEPQPGQLPTQLTPREAG